MYTHTHTPTHTFAHTLVKSLSAKVTWYRGCALQQHREGESHWADVRWGLNTASVWTFQEGKAKCASQDEQSDCGGESQPHAEKGYQRGQWEVGLTVSGWRPWDPGPWACSFHSGTVWGHSDWNHLEHEKKPHDAFPVFVSSKRQVPKNQEDLLWDWGWESWSEGQIYTVGLHGRSWAQFR